MMTSLGKCLTSLVVGNSMVFMLLIRGAKCRGIIWELARLQKSPHAHSLSLSGVLGKKSRSLVKGVDANAVVVCS